MTAKMRTMYGILAVHTESKRQFGTPRLIQESNFNERGYYYYYYYYYHHHHHNHHDKFYLTSEGRAVGACEHGNGCFD
jgi:hypothetical protein